MFTDQLLMAMPSLGDKIFFHGVIYVCQHSEEGATGLLINQPTDFKLDFIFDQLDISVSRSDIADKTVLFGGPLQQDRGFLLHKPSKELQSSLLVSDTVSISTSKESLSELAKGNGPKDALVALGYAAWGPEQLDKEIQENTWLHCPSTENLLYNTAYDKRWEEAINTIGVDVNKLTTGFGHG